MQLTFLGTTAMVPTKDRNHAGIYLDYKGCGILFDCGEGIQRQIRIAGLKPSKLKQIFISHWHGDHVLGLPGLLQTLVWQDFDRTLKIYGPKGSKKYFDHMMKGFNSGAIVPVEIIEIEKDGTVYNGTDYSVKAFKLSHSDLCYGFRLVEKDRRRIHIDHVRKLGIPDGPLLGKLQDGKDVTFKGKKVKVDEATYMVKGKIIGYVADTEGCLNASKIVEGADIAIMEATLLGNKEDKAEEYKHMTAQQSAQIASQADVKKLILTHFSQRYKSTEDLQEEAREIFPETECAYDFMKVKV